MAEKSIKQQTLSGVKWTAVEQFSTQAITFVLGIIIARLLAPSDYGTIGVLTVFMALSQTFVDSGMGTALVRKPDLTETDCSTVFYFNIVVSVLCYLILFISAPLIASFFNLPILVDVVKVYCLTIVISAFEAVHVSRLTIQLNFRLLAKINVISTIISGLVGVAFAYLGLGVWALVWQSVLSRLLHLILIWLLTRWYPKLIFSKKSFRDLFSFGGNLLAGGLLWQLYSNLIPIVIGKFFSARDLGFYTRGTSLAQYPENTILGIIEKVTFPILAKLQNDTARLVIIYRKYIKVTSLAIMFAMLLFASLAKPIVLLLLTDKWESCIVYLQIFVFCVIFDHIQKLNLNLLKVTGYSGLILKLEVYKRITSISLILVSIPFGVIGICISQVIYAQLALMFNTYSTGKKFGLGYYQQVKDFIPYLFMSFISCAPAYLLTFCSISYTVMIIIGSFFAVFLYWIMLKYRHDQIYMEFADSFYTKILKK